VNRFRLATLAVAAALTVGASPRLMSPREQSEMVNAPMRRITVVQAPAAEQVILTWTYPVPLPRAGVVFDVEHRTEMRTGSWLKVGETYGPPFTYIVTGKKSGFFRVMTRSTGTVSLAWDASSSPGVTAYRIHRGPTSHNYTNTIPFGNVTTATISNVVARTFFSATALDGVNRESLPSNEVDYVPGPVYPVTGLTITKL